MVHRIYVEKAPAHAQLARELKGELIAFLGVEGLTGLRIVNRYDVEGLAGELFASCRHTVFSEPQVDLVYDTLPTAGYDRLFAVEYLPGQFDQRADSAAQCVQLISMGQRPTVRTARLYLLCGDITLDQLEAIKKYVINPVESREATLEEYSTLETELVLPGPVAVLEGFTALSDRELEGLVEEYGLAMDMDDLRFCRDYFLSLGRQPTLTELRVIDTYWSDHCRHTTFGTILEAVSFEDERVQSAYDRYMGLRQKLGVKKPVTLMDAATIGAKYLVRSGALLDLDQSEEINACTVKCDITVDGDTQPWLLFFKNETHNHPTEIEPFGGAATCIGGAIRDPLSGRGYVYQAMRVTGGGDPRLPLENTLPGKLSQRKILTGAASGYSSYGNQIGLATGLVDEIYHPGYVAKHMEIGAVLGAAPAKNVRRSAPLPGDVVLLLGGRTGRDGCGGATGSSKSHTQGSLASCGAEVQKGNAPEERKLQRLFRNPTAAAMIKRCNDFGAGGVSVAIGELADGLDIDLDAVKKKYDGLDGTELAISESQERMAVVVDRADLAAFSSLAHAENLECTLVATVAERPRLTMNWGGRQIVALDRSFLDTNGAPKRAKALVTKGLPYDYPYAEGTVKERMEGLVSDLNVCSKRGLAERFDSTIGSAAVLMPFGGKNQLTPIQAMAAKLPVQGGQTTAATLMAYGYNPYISEKSPYAGAYLAVVESVSKVVAAGGNVKKCWLSFQEYFERLGAPEKWGKPLGALLGALDAQIGLSVGAIGGKDSMSGSFEELSVPPTLVSFAVSLTDSGNVISPEFKRAGSKVVLLAPETKDGLPSASALTGLYSQVSGLIAKKRVLSAYTPAFGGVAEGLFKMCLGNRLGFALDKDMDPKELFKYCYGGFILELAQDMDIGVALGRVCEDYQMTLGQSVLELDRLQRCYEHTLEGVYPTLTAATRQLLPVVNYAAPSRCAPKIKVAKPRALIPVFPGTNCEYDSAAALERAGAVARVFVVNNLSPKDVARSVKEFAALLDDSQILFLPGGFSGGDEPEGSAKFIAAFLRNPHISQSLADLIENRDGLVGGICNGFQALIKLGLVPYGKLRPMDADCPTLTFNRIGRHQSRLVRTRVGSNKSPWLMYTEPGDIYLTPISHGEGRFTAPMELVEELAQRGQIATQYVDERGVASYSVDVNPNGSEMAIEGITSPDGRILGKMAHSERVGRDLYKNVPGQSDIRLFQGAVDYFS